MTFLSYKDTETLPKCWSCFAALAPRLSPEAEGAGERACSLYVPHCTSVLLEPRDENTLLARANRPKLRMQGSSQPVGLATGQYLYLK